MERRQFVKGLAATPLALALTNLGCKDESQKATPAVHGAMDQAAKKFGDGKKTLNVYIHGMFAIVLDETKNLTPTQAGVVTLRAPGVGDHAYQALTFTNNPSDPTDLNPGSLNHVPKMGSADKVVFSDGSPRQSTMPVGIAPGSLDHLAIKNQPASKVLPYWTVTLPMPDYICGLRPSLLNYFAPKHFLSKIVRTYNTFNDNKMQIHQHMPQIYVLSYQNLDINPAAGKYVKFNESPIDFGSDGIGRLHLYAERPTPPDRTCDANMAIKQLNVLFEPKLDLHFWGNLCDYKFLIARDAQLPSCTVPGMVMCEERSIIEMNQFKKCSEFLAQPDLDQQFAKVIKVEQEFGFFSLGDRSHALSPSLALTTERYEELYKELVNAAPSDKPPHNCTSLLCLEKKPV